MAAPKKNIKPAEVKPSKIKSNKPWVGLSVIIAALFFLYCFLLYKNISYPLLWNDETETAMTAKQIIKYGYPKVHDGENIIFLPDDTTWIGYKPAYDANITMPWACYYFAVPGVWLADHASDLYVKTALVRIPFVTIGLLGLIIFILPFWSFFKNKVAAQAFVAGFFVLELFSVALFLHMREVRYYSMVIFIVACFFYVFYNYYLLNKYSYKKYLLWMTAILFFAYQINFATFSSCCAVLGLYELFTRLGNLISGLAKREKFLPLFLNQFITSLKNISPIIISCILVLPFIIFFETFTTAARANIQYHYSWENYLSHINRIIYVFQNYEFALVALFVKAMQLIVWLVEKLLHRNKKDAYPNERFHKLSFFLTLFFIAFSILVARIPMFWIRYFIVLQPIFVLIILTDILIVFNYIGNHFSKPIKLLLGFSFAASISFIIVVTADQKIFFLKEYIYQITNQYKGPLDYLIPYIKDNYARTDTITIATNYEELSYMYYLNCRIAVGFKNLKVKFNTRQPDIVIFRKQWGHDPTIFNELLHKASYKKIFFPVYDYPVNNLAELSNVLQHQFRTHLTNVESEQTDIIVRTDINNQK